MIGKECKRLGLRLGVLQTLPKKKGGVTLLGPTQELVKGAPVVRHKTEGNMGRIWPFLPKDQKFDRGASNRNGQWKGPRHPKPHLGGKSGHATMGWVQYLKKRGKD